jgi:hypothetical protein
MSLGLLGDYGSGSEISDSDGEYEQASRNDNQSSKKSDTATSKTEPLIDTCSGAAEGDSENATGREGDPLSYIQGDASSSDNDSSSDEDAHPGDQDTAVPLPLPDLDQLTSPTSREMSTTFKSVFSNPYKEAEEAKLSMLKRHVSEFAPDEKPPSRQERSRHHRFKGNRGNKGSKAPMVRHGPDATNTPGGSGATDSQRFFNDDDSCVVLEGGGFAHHDGDGAKRKQRSGVSSTLVPPKKYLKSYGRAQAEERPWTVGSLTDSHKR